MTDVSVSALLARYERPGAADTRTPGPTKRPWVLVNMVLTLDGRSALEGRAGPLSSAADHAVFGHLRALADVVLVGAGTVRAEAYGPVRLDDEQCSARVARGQDEVPRLAIVSRSLELPDKVLAVSPPPLVLTAEAADAKRLAALDGRAEVVVAGEREVDVGRALSMLRTRGVEVVLCEGGEALNNTLVRGDLVDEWCVTVAPVLGGDDLGLAGIGFGLHRLVLVHAVAVEDHVFLRYRRRRHGDG